MPNTRNIKDTISRESAAGTPVDREYAMPLTNLSGMDTEIAKEDDPANTGKLITSGSYLTKKDSKDAGTAITPRACRAMALIIHSNMGGGIVSGNDLQGVQIGAIVRVKYTGAEASCKITIDQTNDELSALTGAKGSETDDANFAAGSAYDISAGTGNTVEDIVNDINGYTGFEAKLVMGDRSISAHELILFDAVDDAGRQAKDTWCFLYFASATSGVYMYEMPFDVSSSEKPTFTRQVDNRGGNEVISGQVFDVLSLSGALGGMCEGNVSGPGLSQYRKKSGIAGTTNTSTALTHIDTRELCPGMTITGTGIPASTTIASITTIDEDGALVLSQAATASADITDIAVDIVAQSINLENVEPFVFAQGKTSIDGSVKSYIRNFSVESNMNHAGDIGYGQGSYARQLQQKGEGMITGTIQLALDSDAYSMRNKAQDNERVAIHYELRGGNLSGGMKEYIIVEMPYCEIKTVSRPENSGQIDLSFDYTATLPNGTVYNPACKMTMICTYATI